METQYLYYLFAILLSIQSDLAELREDHGFALVFNLAALALFVCAVLHSFGVLE